MPRIVRGGLIQATLCEPATSPVAKIKAASVLAAMSETYKDVRDLSQPTFKPDALTS